MTAIRYRPLSAMILLGGMLISSPALAWGPGFQMAVIDEAWKAVQETVTRQFPGPASKFSPQDWQRLAGYAYGGVIAADKDHYELLDRDYLFTDLCYSLLSGDLATEMRSLARTPEETAFAAGWQAAFVAGRLGHRSFVNPLIGKTAGTAAVPPGDNEKIASKVKLFLDGYWVTDRDRPLAFCPDLVNRALTRVYGISWSQETRFFHPAPHGCLIQLGMNEFRRAWKGSERRTQTTRVGFTYKIMTTSGRLSLALRLAYPAADFGAVEKIFAADRGYESRLFDTFYRIVGAVRDQLAQPAALSNLTLHLDVPPLEDRGYRYTVRGLQGWLKYGRFDLLTPERARLLQAYRSRYLP